MTDRSDRTREVLTQLTGEELALEGGELLPDKEVLSVLDVFVNLDIALDLAAPIDLAVAANANVAAAVDAAATANLLSFGSTATALSQQGAMIDQFISGEAIASAPQDAVIDQSNDVVDPGSNGGDTTGDATAPIIVDDTSGAVDDGSGAIDAGGTVGNTVDGTVGDTVGGTIDGTVGDAAGDVTTDPVGDVSTDPVGDVTGSGLLDGPLLNVEVDAAIDADLAAPVAGAVAANANVAAPIDAAVAANVASFDSSATAVADQTAIINQSLDGVTAEATATQEAEITQ
jgi:hypothetical protein